MNLQLALIAIGIVVVAAIYFYSRWEAPRNKHKRHRSALRSATEPSFGRDEPSSFSTDSYLDADSAIDTGNTIEEASEDEGIVEQEYSKSVEIKISDQAESQAKEDTFQETLEGDILAAEIPVLDSRVDTAQQADEVDEEVPSWQDETEPESELSEPESDSESIESSIPTEQEEPEFDEQGETDPQGEQALETENVPEQIDQRDTSEEELPIESVAEESAASSDVVSDREAASDTEHDSEPEGSESPEFAIAEAESGSTAESAADEHDPEDDSEQPDYEEDASNTKASKEKPSFKRFLGSIKHIHKIKDSIQHKLDAVKAEREKTWEDTDQDGAEIQDFDQGQVGLFDQVQETAAEQEVPEQTADIAETRQEPSLSKGIELASQPEQELEHPQATASDGDSRVSITAAEGFEKLSQIDYYVKLSGERDVSRDSVLAIYREGAAGLSKAHSIYGLRMPDKVWRDLENEPEESRFGDLVITIQLADQSGPVTEHDMTRFSALVMKLSESAGRGFAFMAPIESAHEQAQAIEKFRKRFDSIFVVNIRPLEEETFDGAIIERCATQIGLTPDTNNFYARYKPVGKQKVCLYSLANMSDTGEFDMDNLRGLKTRGVTFFTRPAVNRSPGAVFAEMVDAAKAFASRIKGEVIAPGYDDLSTEDVEAIRKSIEKVASEMESYGIIPGSEEATRLF
ncbi:MAG: cell division protein ZipA C-terminal FtsZ-binding domain-containing protein [Gammaproteobacteria bacterium]